MGFVAKNRPSASVPHTPLTKWTESAPTGSSILILSKNSTANTTSTPATKPITAPAPMVTNAHGAVIATKPARQPLRIIERSGFFRNSQAVIKAPSEPVAAAMLVLTSTCAMALPFIAAMVEPGLNPNQPSHRINTPSGGGSHVVTGNGADLAVLGVFAEARTEHDDARQGRPPAHRVNDRGAGEVAEVVRRRDNPHPRSSGR